MKHKEALSRLEGLAERWDETPEWHNPPFLDGEIHIDTGDLLAIRTVLNGLNKRETGLKYTDGDPICEGDTIVLWHDVESQKKLVPYERVVKWSNKHGGFIAVCPKNGWSDFLYNSINDVNCQEVSKKV